MFSSLSGWKSYESYVENCQKASEIFILCVAKYWLLRIFGGALPWSSEALLRVSSRDHLELLKTASTVLMLDTPSVNLLGRRDKKPPLSTTFYQ